MGKKYYSAKEKEASFRCCFCTPTHQSARGRGAVLLSKVERRYLMERERGKGEKDCLGKNWKIKWRGSS